MCRRESLCLTSRKTFLEKPSKVYCMEAQFGSRRPVHSSYEVAESQGWVLNRSSCREHIGLIFRAIPSGGKMGHSKAVIKYFFKSLIFLISKLHFLLGR